MGRDGWEGMIGDEDGLGRLGVRGGGGGCGGSGLRFELLRGGAD